MKAEGGRRKAEEKSARNGRFFFIPLPAGSARSQRPTPCGAVARGGPPFLERKEKILFTGDSETETLRSGMNPRNVRGAVGEPNSPLGSLGAGEHRHGNRRCGLMHTAFNEPSLEPIKIP